MSDVTSRASPAERVWLIVGCAAVVAGAVLRIRHLGYGLPSIPDVDASKWIDDATRIAKGGSWLPTSLQDPTFYTYVLAVLFRIVPRDSLHAHLYIGRVVSAGFGVALIGLALILGRRVAGGFTGAVAAWLTALSVVCITSSRMTAADTMTACLVTGALVGLVRDPLRLRDVVAAGALAGFAAGTKFTGAIVMVTVIGAAIASGAAGREWLKAVRASLAAALAGAAAFLAVTPAFVPLFSAYLDRIGLEAVMQRSGRLGHVQLGWLDYLFSLTPTCEQPWQGTSLLADAGPLVLLLAIGGAGMALAGRLGRGRWPLAVHAIVLLLVVAGPGHVKALRLLLPILPALFVLAGALVEKLAPWAVVRAASLALLAAWPAYHAVGYVASFSADPTNAPAAKWIERHIRPGSRVMLWPLFTDELRTLPYEILTVDGYGARQYGLPEGRGASPEREPIFAPQILDQARQASLQWVIVNSYVGNQFAPTPENLRWFPRSVAAYAATMEKLRAAADLEYEIRGWSYGRQGPDILVYRLRTEPPRPQKR
jgi:hypothetical protein